MINDQAPMAGHSATGSKTSAVGCWLIGCWLVASSAAMSAIGATVATAETTPGASSAIARFAQLPLSFEANRGQTDPTVQFLARGRDHTIYLSAEGATIALQLARASTNSSAIGSRLGRVPAGSESITRLVRMTLPGANANSIVTGLEPGRSRINYLVGNDPSRWQQAVPNYARVQYAAIHPGVDLVYYGNQQQLEYDFVVTAGADPSVISMHFEGADRIEIDAGGDLILHVEDHQLRQLRPVSYQIIEGRRRPVTSRFILKDAKTVSFALGEYDRRHALTIDPTLSYSTFFGGAKGDIGWAIAADALGHAYIAGETLSTLKNLSESDSAIKTNAVNDAFVARLDATNLLSANPDLTLGYVTYLGGHALDGALGVAVDAAGDAYVTGYTMSSNFPTFSASTVLQSKIGGTNIARFNAHFVDAFVAKLATNGTLIYSTYLGGSFDDYGRDIAVDSSGRAYVAGYADSMLVFRVTNSVATTKCTNGVCGTPVMSTSTSYVKDVVPFITTNTVIKKLSNGTTNTNDTIVVTTPIWVNAPSNSPANGFPITANAVQTNNAGDVLVPDPDRHGGDLNDFTADLFVSRLSPDGSVLEFSTYLGGSAEEFGAGVAVDLLGNFIISGYTESANFPTTNAFQSELSGARDAVVAKFDASGNLVYSTFLGGTLSDTGGRVAVDAAGFAYLAGATGSSDFPSTPSAFNRGGVYVNTGSGTNSWTNSSSGLTHTVVRAFVADSLNAGTLYAGTPRGVFKSLDGGANWTGVNTGLVNRTVNALVLDPFHPGTIYAGTAGGVFVSTDAGVNWTNRNDGLGSLDVRVLQFHPNNSNLWAGTVRGAYQWPLGATNWSLLGLGLQSRTLTAFALNPLDLVNVYAGTTVGIFKSTNSGANWKASNSGLKSTQVRSLVIAPDAPTRLYAGTVKGLYISTNAAANWSLRTNGLNRPQINTLLIDSGSPATIYAGSTNGLFKSVDAGENWLPSQNDLLTRSVVALSFDPASTATLYAGTSSPNFAGGTNDAFLVKLAPDGLSLAYALTLGGNRNDEAADVAVDADGFVTIIGQTASKNLPVSGFDTNTPSYQTNLSGKVDAFVSKFDPTGATNLFTMYFGGKRNDFGHSVALDPAGSTYIVGRTESSGFPTTTNRLENVDGVPVKFSGGGRDAFIAKLAAENLGMLALTAGENVIVTWPAPAPEFILESRRLGETSWTPVDAEPAVVNGRHTVVIPAATAGQFFRLRTP